jgi:hypothetical protein
MLSSRTQRSGDPGPPEARRSGVGPGSARYALVRDDNDGCYAAAFQAWVISVTGE